MAIRIARGPDNDVGITIPVHVAGRGHRLPEGCVHQIPFGMPVVQIAQAILRAVPDPDHALFTLSVVIQRRADDHVRVAIGVHVPRRCHRGAKARAGLVGLVVRRRDSLEAIRGAVIYPAPSFPVLSIAIAWRADDDVGETVAVHISGCGHRPAKVVPVMATHLVPIGECVQTAG